MTKEILGKEELDDKAAKAAKASKRKKMLLIFGAVLLALITLIIVLTLIFHEGYLKKTDFDHVAAVSYGNVRIVGRDGLFYLERDGKAVGDGYVSLRSVNDAYATLNPLWQSADDLVFYDFFIARRAGEAEYYLLSSDGDEYVISGENYSLSAIRLPYLIFVNNTTGREAVLSLDKLDSDLSYRSGNELTLKPFTSVTPVREAPDRLLYSHLETYDASADHPYSVFSNNGTCLFSAEELEKKVYADGDLYRATYYRDTHDGIVYDADGTILGQGPSPLSDPRGNWAWSALSDKSEEEDGILLLTPRKSVFLSEKDYDMASVTPLGGCLILPLANGEGQALVSAVNGTVTRCQTVSVSPEGLPVATLSGHDGVTLFSENGILLLQTEYTDMLLSPTLSDSLCKVYESAQYNADHGGRFLHFTREGSAASTVGVESDVSLSPLKTVDGISVSGSFLLTESDQDGNNVYRLLLPFTSRIFSDTYNALDVYWQADILWAMGTSYERLTYTFLDPLAGQTATTVTCTEEEMALAHFTVEKADSLLSDLYDADSAVPLLMLRLSYDREDTQDTNTVRHFALYRSAAVASRAFNLSSLHVTELGKGLLRSNPFTLFPNDNAVVCHDADSSRVWRLNDTNLLIESVSIPYHVTSLLRDSSDPALLYYVVESDTGKKGLYDGNGSPILAPYYDDIRSADNNHFVISLRGAYGVVEYTAGSLRNILDYLYVEITPLPDHAYLAVNGDREVYLFEGRDLLSDKSVQSHSILRTYYINEDAELCYRLTLSISIEGKLSLHECDTELRPAVTDFAHATVSNPTLTDRRAMAVYYYHEGRRIRTDVIFPTASEHAAFSVPTPEVGDGWYTVPHPTDSDLPITKDELLALSKHTVSLYTKS